MLRLYHAWIRVHGVVFFSSRVYPAGGAGGTAEETAPYLHNYPLIYALSGRPAESYAVVPSLHYGSYRASGRRARGRLRYPLVERVLAGLAGGGLGEGLVYAYPAAPRRVAAYKFFMSAQGMGYPEYRGKLKVGFPRLVNLVGLGPGSELEAFVVAGGELPRRLYTRLGMKRMGAILVELDPAEPVERVDDSVYSSHPVNLGDVVGWGLRVEDYSVVLETRSKPWMGDSLCTLCSMVGYVKAAGMYRVEWRDSVTKRRESAVIPLPPALAAAARPRGRRRAEPAW